MTSGVFSMWWFHSIREVGVFTEKVGVFARKVAGSTAYLYLLREHIILYSTIKSSESTTHKIGRKAARLEEHSSNIYRVSFSCQP